MHTPRSLGLRLRMLPVALATVAGVAACSAGSPAPTATLAGPRPIASTASASSVRAEPGLCAIDGTVKDTTGAPVVGALVAAIPSYGQREAALVRSTAGGGFCVKGLPAGEYGLTITSSELTSTYVDVFAVGGDGGHGLEVRLGGAGFTLRGRLLDQAGKSAGKRALRIGRSSTFFADLFIVESGDDGSYAVKLPAAGYHVMVVSDDAVGAHEELVLASDQSADIVMTAQNPRSRPPPAEVVEWLKKKAIPLTTAEPGHGTDDLEPLRAVVGGARVVSLGEATHGTREFFQMKHRMLEFLVEKMGFRSFAIEGSFPEALALDSYVRTGKGDPAAAVAAMGFWTWDTEEIVAMVRWMRRYNEDAAHKEKLRFFGVDMQMPADSVRALAAALREIDRKLWAEVAASLQPIDDGWSGASFHELSKSEQAVVAAATAKLVARLEERRDADVKKLGAEGWALARIHAHVLADFVEMTQKDAVDPAVRDRAMAANALRLLEMLGPASKMVLWSHNGHAQRSPVTGPATMGGELAKKLGDGLVTFGFAFDQGDFNAMELGQTGRGLYPFTVPAALPGSLDGALALAGLPLLALDLRTATGAAATWLATPTAQRRIGSVYNAANPESFYDTAAPAALYDALLFVARTSAAVATATGKRPVVKTTPRAELGNAGFEDGAAGEAPPLWNLSAYPRSFKYRATLVRERPASGKLAVKLEREPSPLGASVATLVQQIEAKALRGKRVRVSAKVRLEAAAVGDEAFVFARSDGGKPSSPSTAVTVAKGYREVAVEVEVGADAERLTLGIALTGGAKVTLDEVVLAAIPEAPAVVVK